MAPNSENPLLTTDQTQALRKLESTTNVFVTGAAGSGKSYLVKHFLKGRKKLPILASTGSAAVLVGGRTFHSFFGLGIMQGGIDATVERALKNKRLIKRLKKATTVIVDEVSMLSGQTLRTAETIARYTRENPDAWGGIRIIAGGDFAQLPPVNPHGTAKDWAFTDITWSKSYFESAVLTSVLRTKDKEYIEVLNFVRDGIVNSQVTDFLNSRLSNNQSDFDGTVLFAHRETTEKYNLSQLENLLGQAVVIETIYSGDKKYLADIERNAPIPKALALKKGALVMIRLNDPQGRWYNGTLGYVSQIGNLVIKVELFNGEIAEIEKTTFEILDADGKEIASATNFPINLAYAATIHKAQGLTLDKVNVDLSQLWEPGQAYVALSRVKSSKGLFISSWKPSSIKADPLVAKFLHSLSH